MADSKMEIRYSGMYNNGRLMDFKDKTADEFRELLREMGYKQGRAKVTQLVQEMYNDDGMVMDTTEFGTGENASIDTVIKGLLSKSKGKKSPGAVPTMQMGDMATALRSVGGSGDE